ncbi:hypothetical protein DENSPDRAFT_871122 [Dentipellis sp. KUC8613]|nr:hypothetical protein DENSPDRAFT_871122 [Dentipellis sp. KUC8613]
MSCVSEKTERQLAHAVIAHRKEKVFGPVNRSKRSREASRCPYARRHTRVDDYLEQEARCSTHRQPSTRLGPLPVFLRRGTIGRALPSQFTVSSTRLPILSLGHVRRMRTGGEAGLHDAGNGDLLVVELISPATQPIPVPAGTPTPTFCGEDVRARRGRGAGVQSWRLGEQKKSSRTKGKRKRETYPCDVRYVEIRRQFLVRNCGDRDVVLEYLCQLGVWGEVLRTVQHNYMYFVSVMESKILWTRQLRPDIEPRKWSLHARRALANIRPCFRLVLGGHLPANVALRQFNLTAASLNTLLVVAFPYRTLPFDSQSRTDRLSNAFACLRGSNMNIYALIIARSCLRPHQRAGRGVDRGRRRPSFRTTLTRRPSSGILGSSSASIQLDFFNMDDYISLSCTSADPAFSLCLFEYDRVSPKWCSVVQQYGVRVHRSVAIKHRA